MALQRWYINNFGAPSTETLMSGVTGSKILVVSLLISNTSTTTDANITVSHLEGSTPIFDWTLTITAGSSPFALDSKIVLNDTDSIEITSDIGDVYVLASGEVD